MEAPAKALPRSYQIVDVEMTSSFRRSAGGDGMDCVTVLEDVFGIYGSSAAQRKPVLDVTGKDLAVIWDERIRGVTLHFDTYRAWLRPRQEAHMVGPC